jgi:hypothetical protein
MSGPIGAGFAATGAGALAGLTAFTSAFGACAATLAEPKVTEQRVNASKLAPNARWWGNLDVMVSRPQKSLPEELLGGGSRD